MSIYSYIVVEDEDGKFHRRFNLSDGHIVDGLSAILLETFANDADANFLINMNKSFLGIYDGSDKVPRKDKGNVVKYGDKAIVVGNESFDYFNSLEEAVEGCDRIIVYLFPQDVKLWSVRIKEIDCFLDLRLMQEIFSAFNGFTDEIGFVQGDDYHIYKAESLFDGNKDITKLYSVIKEVLSLGNNEKLFTYLDSIYGQAMNVKNIVEEVKILMECENLEDSILKKLTGKELKKFKV